MANVGSYVDITVSGAGLVLDFGPGGYGGNSPLAVLRGVATNLQAMINHNAPRLG